jgi:hypothetical protein|nr:MAG TPA_asm: hypothetical protein [Caudoviricetes sp.]
MKMYKGFDKDLKCRGFQYEIGKTYEEPTADLCKSGFHACEYPLDVFDYYAPGAMSRYCEVDLNELSDERSSGDSKCCGKKIAVKAEIGIAGLVKASVDYVMKHIDSSKKESNTGNYSASTNTGFCSASTNTGFRSASTNTGFRSASTNTGDYSASTNTGDYSASTVEGAESVAAALGIEGKARGALGCWIVLAEWSKDKKDSWHRKDVQCFKVDGETVKPDTFYTLKNGELVEVSE